MSTSLLPEIFDLVIDHSREDRFALRACCLVSKSWVAPARRHLFARIDFQRTPVESWMKAFPDPSNSPAHYTRYLFIRSVSDLITATTNGCAWIRAFNNVVSLTIETFGSNDRHISLVPLHALSPTLRTLSLSYSSISSSEVFNLICTFPSLENLSLLSFGDRKTDVPTIPSVPFKFTGNLYLLVTSGIRFDVRRLLAFPGGLHFSNIWLRCLTEDVESTISLVSACCNTLESFGILYYLPNPCEMPIPVDLSTATKLKQVEFRFGRPSARWISMALQTVSSKNLKQITLHHDARFDRERRVGEEFVPEWHDLDKLLVQFWTSHSIRPKLIDRGHYLDAHTPTLFPELTKRKLLDVV